MSQYKKQIPQFADEDEEREFWAENDSTDYVDWSAAKSLEIPLDERIEQELRLRRA